MKRFNYLLATAILFAAACNNASDTKTTEKKDSVKETSTVKETPEPELSPAEQQKKWMEYATPGEVHKMLAKDNGVWTSEITSWMAPDSPAVKSMGTAVNTMILGGRYQQSVHKSTFFGQPFEGISTLGYDNAKKTLISSWVDNMGTGMMIMEGTWDDKTKSVTSKGKMVDPTTGKDVEVREVWKWIDDNNQLMEMYCTAHGKKEYKNMEIRLTRKK